jgi:hypothetical protein
MLFGNNYNKILTEPIKPTKEFFDDLTELNGQLTNHPASEFELTIPFHEKYSKYLTKKQCVLAAMEKDGTVFNFISLSLQLDNEILALARKSKDVDNLFSKPLSGDPNFFKSHNLQSLSEDYIYFITTKQSSLISQFTQYIFASINNIGLEESDAKKYKFLITNNVKDKIFIEIFKGLCFGFAVFRGLKGENAIMLLKAIMLLNAYDINDDSDFQALKKHKSFAALLTPFTNKKALFDDVIYFIVKNQCGDKLLELVLKVLPEKYQNQNNELKLQLQSHEVNEELQVQKLKKNALIITEGEKRMACNLEFCESIFGKFSSNDLTQLLEKEWYLQDKNKLRFILLSVPRTSYNEPHVLLIEYRNNCYLLYESNDRRPKYTNITLDKVTEIIINKFHNLLCIHYLAWQVTEENNNLLQQNNEIDKNKEKHYAMQNQSPNECKGIDYYKKKLITDPLALFDNVPQTATPVILNGLLCCYQKYFTVIVEKARNNIALCEKIADFLEYVDQLQKRSQETKEINPELNNTIRMINNIAQESKKFRDSLQNIIEKYSDRQLNNILQPDDGEKNTSSDLKLK